MRFDALENSIGGLARGNPPVRTVTLHDVEIATEVILYPVHCLTVLLTNGNLNVELCLNFATFSLEETYIALPIEETSHVDECVFF